MTQYLNTVIDRPITDFRHFSSVLNADATVKHHWTAIQPKAYRAPANNYWRIPARKGGVALDAYDNNVTWGARGNYQVPLFTHDGQNRGRFSAIIPNPGNVISVLMLCRCGAAATEAWSLNWASDSSFVFYQPFRTSSNRTVNASGSQVDFGTPAPMNQWNFEAVVIDLTSNVFASSFNNGAFAIGSPATAMPPKTDANLTLMFGQGNIAQPFGLGMISDLAIVAGDVRTMPNLMSAFQNYNQTGYV